MPFRALIAGVTGLAVLAAGCAQPAGDNDADLHRIVEAVGLTELRHSPEQADMLGISVEQFGGRYDNLLDQRSIAASERRRIERLDYLKQLESIDRTRLTQSGIQELDNALFVIGADVRMDRYAYGYADLGWASPYIINQSDGAYTDLVKFLTIHHPIRSRADAVAWLDRLRQVDDAITDERRRFEVDVESGGSPPRAIVQRTLDKAKALHPADARTSALLLYFSEQLSQLTDIPVGEMTSLIDEAASVIEMHVEPAYGKLIATLEKVLQDAPEEPGVWRLKSGDAYYRDALYLYTTTDLTPEQIRDVGLAIVAELTTEMDGMLIGVGRVEGTVGQRMQAMSVDPLYLYPETPEGQALLAASLEQQMKWAETKLSALVSVGPQTKVEVRQVPALAYDTASSAYYKAASLDGLRAATYNIKLRTMADWPTWSLPTLTYHEAAPGHHVQTALARERRNQPVLNYLVATPAFSEGWALYAEDLANEVGAYDQDPLGKLGYLQSLLFRAARMVVDTGLHEYRWSRDQAVTYMVDTTGMPRAQMENEVDRYIIWPGQACSYMIGREKIRNLREDADVELGPDFDLKAFHDAVLAGGGRPLGVLEADIQNWIVSRRPAPVAEVAQK